MKEEGGRVEDESEQMLRSDLPGDLGGTGGSPTSAALGELLELHAAMSHWKTFIPVGADRRSLKTDRSQPTMSMEQAMSSGSAHSTCFT
jgi:hypothetical protein